jgi:hypothetical protein
MLASPVRHDDPDVGDSGEPPIASYTTLLPEGSGRYLLGWPEMCARDHECRKNITRKTPSAILSPLVLFN